ncbi:bifunctional adenosylcobinamide kinase/adenosylcobinamide-phosphate guanylyltransferase [Sporosarcina limicola]|uniref:Adenosylcobinamide kinase n=1 Tax=Sporosarcina limicola TaxID=34101 RepID=A0A927MJW8_9BACL|nr:bifunctional adenosylcobinamide kinase/adenosylcobinamide-phosphate guanylyltransferase [Sporosarcina limicola]MBE1555745.1 adenosylcobinamide kinase/adenosylcobinamide-phosphate guanylyltransferase [Sporosarcina limicola]
MVRGKLKVVIGGVRSGKSAYAERFLIEEVQRDGGRLVYIASGTATDSEMQERIDRHRLERVTTDWTTIEQPMKLEEVLPAIRQGDAVLWDCVTTWLANELYAGWDFGTPCIGDPDCMEQKEVRLFETIESLLTEAAHLVIVSNEVLDELPSMYAETRIYCEWLGRIHRKLVSIADTAIEMDCGIALYWKNGGKEVAE